MKRINRTDNTISKNQARDGMNENGTEIFQIDSMRKLVETLTENESKRKEEKRYLRKWKWLIWTMVIWNVLYGGREEFFVMRLFV